MFYYYYYYYMLHFVHYKSTYNKGINGAFCTIDFHEIDVISSMETTAMRTKQKNFQLKID